jgi:hypothetical protein
MTTKSSIHLYVRIVIVAVIVVAIVVVLFLPGISDQELV